MRLELSEPDVIFEPSLDTNIVNNFYDMVLGWIDDVMHVCRLIPRLAKHEKIKHHHPNKDEDAG